MCNGPLFSRCGRPLLVAGGPFRDDRWVAEGIIQRYRCGIAWRDVPAELVVADDLEAAPPLQRLRNLGQYLASLLTGAGSRRAVDWSISVDLTVNRAHQCGTNLPRATEGQGERHESVC